MLLDLPNRFANPIEEPEIPDPDGKRKWRFVADPLLDCAYYFGLLRAKNADSTTGRIDLATEFLSGAIHPHDKPAFDERLAEAGVLGGIWRTQAAVALLTHYITGGENLSKLRKPTGSADPDADGEIVDLTDKAVEDTPLSSG